MTEFGIPVNAKSGLAHFELVRLGELPLDLSPFRTYALTFDFVARERSENRAKM